MGPASEVKAFIFKAFPNALIAQVDLYLAGS